MKRLVSNVPLASFGVFVRSWRSILFPFSLCLPAVVFAESRSHLVNKEVFARVRIESMQYFSEIPESPQLTRSYFISSDFFAQGQSSFFPGLTYQVDLQAGSFLRGSQTDMAVRELSLLKVSSPSMSSYVGRHRFTWSEMDDRWRLGLWQPRFALDSLRAEPQGLTGFFGTYAEGPLQITGFLTPIFIPTMGPTVREDKGALVSDSRWYRQPSQEYQFSNRINQIYYKLDVPNAARLVANPATALSLSMNEPTENARGAWFRSSVGYKPVNDLLLKRQNFKAIAEDRVDVTVSPDVVYHQIFSVDWGFKTDQWGGSISFLDDQPAEKPSDGDWVIQRLQPLRSYSAQMDWRLSGILSSQLQVELGYLRVNGGGIVDVQSSGAQDDFTLFDQRMMFTNAISMGLHGQLIRLGNHPLSAQWRYLYDWDQAGSMMSTEFQYQAARDLAFLVGADVLGVEESSPRPSGFLNQFRANDRVYGGMTYVF